ncbi:hypothetical protein [Polaribacter sp. Hel_I_88]|uniref:hypothetical protein n=1 Tax=Polaribacter sp. Hel_I_88 TaxID=1250006 RepID=UPI00047A8B82|nr:hypothetical protein [Polaribacter sp. Hel_I_88]
MRFPVPPFFERDKVYNISEVETWFDENWQKYNWVADLWRCKYCSNRRRKLPCICKEPDEQWKFLKLYEAIDELLRFHRKETYFKNELIEYNEAKYSDINLKIWAAKNEKIGTDGCVSFSSKYLKEGKDCDKTRSIRVYGSSELELFVVNKIREQAGRGGNKTKLDFEVFIQKQDFKYTIEFIKVFDDVFWVQEILPESITRIEKK